MLVTRRINPIFNRERTAYYAKKCYHSRNQRPRPELNHRYSQDNLCDFVFEVYNKDLGKLSELFEIMNEFAEKWNVEYFVSEIDTEQLFLLYTADQRPDDTETRVYL